MTEHKKRWVKVEGGFLEKVNFGGGKSSYLGIVKSVKPRRKAWTGSVQGLRGHWHNKTVMWKSCGK